MSYATLPHSTFRRSILDGTNQIGCLRIRREQRKKLQSEPMLVIEKILLWKGKGLCRARRAELSKG